MRAALALLVGLLAVLATWLFLRRVPERPPATARPAASQPACSRPAPPAAAPAPATLPAEQVRWLAIGAVATPDASQVSIEQDLALVRSALGPDGEILFAGGRGARDVQIEARRPRGDRFLEELATLLAPRGGRTSRYRESPLPLAGPATLEEVRGALQRLLPAGRAPLLIYLGGHGERGEQPGKNYVALWGGRSLAAQDLAEWLEPATRPVQLVVTSCYAGGFADALFRDADPSHGPAPKRCGFFATTHDLPASGCDPNPDRRAQEGYALHFFNALRGRDRDGRPLALAALDLDGDGRVSLAEAHARTRVALGSVDVPTATSERWLRQVKLRSRRRVVVPLPEEQAVVRALRRRTGLARSLAAVRRALDEREDRIDEVRARVDELSAAEDSAARRAVAGLLARWPILDDPWHPDFAETVRCERAAIEAHLRSSAVYADYLEAGREADAAEAEYWELRRRAAPVERLVRALENLELAGRLRAQGGPDWDRFEALLACERAVPAAQVAREAR